MRISRMLSCAALAAMLAAAASPAPASAQFGKLLKKAVKKTVVEAVVEKTANTTGEQADTAAVEEPSAARRGAVPTAKKGARAAPHPGPTFTEYVLEMTPELLDRVEKGLVAEEVVRQDIERLVGKVLSRDAYDACEKKVMTSPEAQKIYMEAGDLMGGDATQEHLQKVSQEMARRFEKVVEPKCGLDPQKAARVREQHAERLAAAAPEASGLTVLQLSILKERILPLCTAVDALVQSAGEARIATESAAISWVYSPGEVQALQPRCGKLAAALKTAL